ncbi:MAG: DUF559 domain-containing protein [Nocardioidaceae bacterium]
MPDTLDDRVLAASLVLHPFGVFCDRTAAWLHGVDALSFRELEILPPVEMVVLRGHTRPRRLHCRGGERDLNIGDVTSVGTCPVTSALRTALDLGCKLKRSEALAVLDGFLRRGLVTREEMLSRLPTYRGRRGVVQLRRLVRLADPRAESTGESWTRLAIVDAGLPTPELQHWVCDRGVPVFRLDLAFPKSKVAIEYDGMEYHDQPADRARDASRREWLRQRGWTVIVVRREDLSGDRRDAWLGRLLRTLQDN